MVLFSLMWEKAVLWGLFRDVETFLKKGGKNFKKHLTRTALGVILVKQRLRETSKRHKRICGEVSKWS